MVPPPVTLAQLRGRVQEVLAKDPEVRVVGVRSGGSWNGPAELEMEKRRFAILDSDSVLEIREKLVELDSDPARGLILLTEKQDRDLGGDILARLAHGRLLSIEPWSIVSALFQAHAFDPGLAGQNDLANGLLEIAPAGGFPAAPTGVLDRETAWKTLLSGLLALSTPRPSPRELLEWTLRPELPQRLKQTSSPLLAGIRDWLRRVTGPLIDPVWSILDSGRAGEIVPLGLACRVLFAEERDAEPGLREASIRLERLTGNLALTPALAQVWAEAAELVLSDVERLEGHAAADRLVKRADEILTELKAEDYAHLSRFSAVGFEILMRRWAEALMTVLEGRGAPGLAGVDDLAKSVGSHVEAERHPARARRVQMAGRLLRWLNGGRSRPGSPAGFEELALDYAGDGSFADWARAALAGGDPEPTVAQAYTRLLSEATRVREKQNFQFAQQLVRWLGSGSAGNRVLPVEQVLERVVAPLLRERPVLLLVIDGMSFPVGHELLWGGIERRWARVGLPETGKAPPLVATIPSVTEISRTSLLCGALKAGAAADEVAGFAANRALLEATRGSLAPLLFHKAKLFEAGGSDLAAEFRTEIANSRRKLVGAVINAVDDYLLKGDQILVQWSIDQILGLPVILDLARQAQRVVVLVSDHGHLLDRSTEQVLQRDHDRYRAVEGPALDRELLVEGRRVGSTPARVYAAWSETMRFGPKKNGYHGGIAPQEMLAPLVILRPVDLPLGAWPDLPYDIPEWWEREVAPPPAELQVAEIGRAVAEGIRVGPAADSLRWVDQLLESELFALQAERVRRQVPTAEEPRRFLLTLLERGGSYPEKALARDLGKSALSIGGFVAIMQRLFNVDGYPVVVHDRESAMVRLNADLLRQQFAVE